MNFPDVVACLTPDQNEGLSNYLNRANGGRRDIRETFADFAADVTRVLGAGQPGHVPGLEPLPAPDVTRVLVNLWEVMVLAAATRVRERDLENARRSMTSAGHLSCPRCCNDGRGDEDEPFQLIVTKDCAYSCGVKIHTGRQGERPSLWVGNQRDEYYDEERDERVCCGRCGFEFEVPAKIDRVDQDEVDGEVILHRDPDGEA